MQQLSLIKADPLFYGGDLVKAKTRRPLDSKRALHLVLKANSSVLRSHEASIREAFFYWAKRFRVKVYSLSVQKDHTHAAIKFSFRRDYLAFIRALTGALAKKIGKGIWKLLPFTRITAWGKAFQKIIKYIRQNELEARGLLPHKPRRNYYRLQNSS